VSITQKDQFGRLPGAREFATTHWSVVLTAGAVDTPQSAAALESLCCAYWYPLYFYVRRQGYSPHQAEDLTQEFFLRVIKKNTLAIANPDRGRFRSFLLTSLKHFLLNEWEKASAGKRGGRELHLSLDSMDAEERYQTELADQSSPDCLFERRWSKTFWRSSKHPTKKPVV
jgi:DNA-directed RNA polymerase specialized sigma24 family protein